MTNNERDIHLIVSINFHNKVKQLVGLHFLLAIENSNMLKCAISSDENPKRWITRKKSTQSILMKLRQQYEGEYQTSQFGTTGQKLQKEILKEPTELSDRLFNESNTNAN